MSLNTANPLDKIPGVAPSPQTVPAESSLLNGTAPVLDNSIPTISTPTPTHHTPPQTTSSSSSSSGTTHTNSTNVQPQPANASGKTQTVFIHKLYDMLHDPSISHLIWWAPSNDSFCLLPGEDFSKVLAQYFKHTNIASFIRQLNMYGFHKVNDTFQNSQNDDSGPPSTTSSISGGSSTTSANKWEFRHSTNQFRKGDVESLKQIKRRSSKNINSHKEVVNLKSLPPTSMPDQSSQQSHQQQQQQQLQNQQQQQQQQQQLQNQQQHQLQNQLQNQQRQQNGPGSQPISQQAQQYHPQDQNHPHYIAPYFIYGDDEGSVASRSRAGSSESLHQAYPPPQVLHHGYQPQGHMQVFMGPNNPPPGSPRSPGSYTPRQHSNPHLHQQQSSQSAAFGQPFPPIHHPIPTPPPQQLHHPHHPAHPGVGSLSGSVSGSFSGPAHGPTSVPENPLQPTQGSAGPAGAANTAAATRERPAAPLTNPSFENSLNFKFIELNSQINSLRSELFTVRDKYDIVSSELKRTQNDTMQILDMLERYLEEEPRINANIFNGPEERSRNNKTPVNVPIVPDSTSPMSRVTNRPIQPKAVPMYLRNEVGALKTILSQRMSVPNYANSAAPATTSSQPAYHLTNSASSRNSSNSQIHIVPQHYPLNPHYTIYNAANKLLKGEEGTSGGRHFSVLMDPLQPVPSYSSRPNDIGKSYSPLSAGKNGYPFPNMVRSQSEDGFKEGEPPKPTLLNTAVFSSNPSGGSKVASSVNPRTNSLPTPLIDRSVRTPEGIPISTSATPYFQTNTSAERYSDRSVTHQQRSSFTGTFHKVNPAAGLHHSSLSLPPTHVPSSTLPSIQKIPNMNVHSEASVQASSNTSSPSETRTLQLPSVGELDKSLKPANLGAAASSAPVALPVPCAPGASSIPQLPSVKAEYDEDPNDPRFKKRKIFG